MKRFTGILAAAAIAIAPMSASALEALTDNAMNDVTAQAGVSIGLDDIVIYQTGVADTTYTDTDGLGDITTAGIKIEYDDAINKLTIIDGITSDTDKDSKYSATALSGIFTPEATGAAAGAIPEVGFIAAGDTAAAVAAGTLDAFNGNTADDDYTTGASPLTIDVGTCESLTAGFVYNGGAEAVAAYNTATGEDRIAQIAGVVIGLPTIEIQSFHTADTKTVSLVNAANTDGDLAINSEHAFIQITKSGTSRMAILGGRIEIAPH